MDALARPRTLGPALAAALALWAAAARADFVTPDSIQRPPPGDVGPADFTRIFSAADLVTGQYAGRGLLFPSRLGAVPGTGPTAAVTDLGGIDVWAPAVRTEATPWAGVLDYSSTLSGALVRKGGPAAASSVTVEVLGSALFGYRLSAFGPGGKLLGWDATPAGVGPHGGRLLTVQAQGITAFQVSRDPLIFPLEPPVPAPFVPWGVAGVAFAPEAPEPCGLVLAGAGLAALAGYGWRRRRRAAA
jgi:hypothetical protein